MFYWHLAIILAPVVAAAIATNKYFLLWFYGTFFPEDIDPYQPVKVTVKGRYGRHYYQRNVVKFYDYAA